ncbi:MAG: DNA methyltransferase [Chloroflexota bacterium]
MPKRERTNKLNDLDPKRWLKFQKSWFIHNPPPRRKNVLRHPAKYPETLVQEFIEFFTHRGQVVLDPMAGTGSTLAAALRCGRRSYGIELNPGYAEIARQVVAEERQALAQAGASGADGPGSREDSGEAGLPAAPDQAALTAEVITGSAGEMARWAAEYHIPPVDYVITSPPYWDMLRMRGAQTQKSRRQSEALDVFYSDDPQDLGNVADYEQFIERLCAIYVDLKPFLAPRAYLTIIVKNVKKGGKVYPLAWDLAARLGRVYTLKDERIWCQDDIRLAPYGMGSAWVSNTFHHYCLQFRNE